MATFFESFDGVADIFNMIQQEENDFGDPVPPPSFNFPTDTTNGHRWATQSMAGAPVAFGTYDLIAELDASGRTGQCLHFNHAETRWVWTMLASLIDSTIGLHRFAPGFSNPAVTNEVWLGVAYDAGDPGYADPLTTYAVLNINADEDLSIGPRNVRLGMYRKGEDLLFGHNIDEAAYLTFAGVLTQDAFVYIEFHYVMDDTVGHLEVKVRNANGVLIATDTFDGDTGFGDTQLGMLRLGSDNNSFSDEDGRLDDLYISNEGFLGSVRVQKLALSGNGASSEWVGSDSDSTDNFDLIKQPSVDGNGWQDDHEFVEATNDGDLDLYEITDPTIYAGEQVLTVLYNVRGRYLIDPKSLAVVEKQDSDEADAPDVIALADTRVDRQVVLPTRPDGGAWTWGDVAAVEVGQRQEA